MEFLFTSLCLGLFCLWINAWMRRRHEERQGKLEAERDKREARAKLQGRLGREPTEDEVYDELWRTRDRDLP